MSWSKSGIAVLLISILIGAVAIMPATAQEKGPILIYSPWKTEMMNEYLDLFTEKTGIKAQQVNISTGEIYARLRVEKANPQADVWHSVRASILAAAVEADLLAEIGNLPNAENVLKPYRYPDNPYFVGTTMYPLVFVINTEVLEEMNLDPPENYKDLLDPKWKGEIVAPHPAASGTAYAFTTTVLQLYREEGETGIESEGGWSYLGDLIPNVDQWTSSGSTPSKLVARGEYPVGISFYDRVYRLRQEGYPVKSIFPDPIYAEPSCTAIVKGAPHPEGAKAFVNFMLSKEAQALGMETGNYPLRADMDPPPGAPPITDLNKFNDDYIWGAENKQAIIAKFSELMWD